MLELAATKDAVGVFVTLTYASEYLPETATLCPSHVKLWLKRIRKKANGKLRYFLVGEYGEETERPHYHLALFGYTQQLCSSCRHCRSRDWLSCDCLIAKTWGMGRPFIGEINRDSAQYIAGYVCKKITFFREDYEKWLNGRHKEFTRMSLKPGIGAGAMKHLGSVLSTPAGAQLIINHGDVPSTIQRGKRQFPLGRYLKKKLREEVGLDEEVLKKENIIRWSAEIASEVEGRTKDCRKSVKGILVEDSSQDRAKQEVRYNIFKQRRTI